jgi:hypothetical protein
MEAKFGSPLKKETADSIHMNFFSEEQRVHPFFTTKGIKKFWKS